MKWLPCVAALLLAGAAAAQAPIFQPDNFLDPRQRSGPVFMSFLLLGAGRGVTDAFRPLHQDVGLLQIANTFYWSRFEAGYNHSETRGEVAGGTVRVQRCGCNTEVYFPTPPPPGAVPAAPLPGSRDTASFAFYHASASGPALRYRFLLTSQRIGTEISVQDGPAVRRSGREQTFAIDGDVNFRGLVGTLYLARTARSGTTDNRTQNELVYTNRFPVLPLPKGVLLRTALTFGAITDRGASGINVVNPLVEAFWHDYRSRVSVHLVYSPQSLHDGNGWTTHHQVAAFIERPLYAKFFHER
ncbi:MAG TPA: hypothetical protein VGR02_13720 [Thermoanaerobaculia bacterium]|jgi:hypothetical protein|nr:hypothetical protein [Thermoanaerobaculia bacterium]